MAVTLIMRVPELTPERYDRMVDELGLDERPSPGLILHVASEGVGAINVLQLWQTQQSAERFIGAQLEAALRRHGVTQPLAYRVEPLHDMIVGDPEIVAALGGTSPGVPASPRAS